MRLVRLSFHGTVTSRSETSGMLHAAGDAVLVERGRPRVLILACPCGCGEELAINLDNQAGPAWRLYRRNRAVTIFPSVWRETGCESHFIVWKDQIYLFGAFHDDDGGYVDELPSDDEAVSHELVLDALSSSSLETFSSIADRLDALPWAVLAVCRRLVAEGAAIEGKGKRRGHFRRALDR